MDVSVIESVRLKAASEEKIVPLSLLDCTTANFAPGSAIWLYQPPKLERAKELNLGYHLRESLAFTLQTHPQFCGRLKAVDNTQGIVPSEAKHLPPHARRFGRIYAHFGTPTDPGVEFVHAKSSATLKSLYPADRTSKHPAWPCESATFQRFLAPAPLAKALEPNVEDGDGQLQPLLTVQVTELACGGFVIAVKAAHPLADASTVIALVKDWALVSQSVLECKAIPPLSRVFNPALLDSHAASDINADQPNDDIIQQAESLPMDRYDWWASASTCPWPLQIPAPFDTPELEPAGKVMPWDEWDLVSPVSNYVIHLTRDQVEFLWNEANKGASQKLSRHDAVLGHIWSRIAHARGQEDDSGSIHCDLVYGVRQSFGLDGKFMGSPTVMMNVELPGSDVAKNTNLGAVATQIRTTLKKVTEPSSMAAHLHSLAFEKSPQRIWQAFLGRRHILVTTWARAGIYDIDFGFQSVCSYAEAVVPDLDGDVLIKEAPGPPSSYWTDNGVDVSVHIRNEDMQRLLKDPLLFLLQVSSSP
ncbi:Hydroxycinnamoyl-Coenzyme A shikimate quinate hydroxycinnamoyltransferase [Fusarium albosuccineum]|uniref:Hydroxycinnamoyl-Coenzyme A shikimate quinate hydroxycinnamoyltransferase n=1 Tax=Fusarium albosuccineum TaxID=1237068 RepID=A0A8H4LE20_9HYPO|nr:Hydroxycinnamoyl-Coenzyme A shikimate quinate hydroxycinnamoyltransferase [Fusarium albosuccineum]